MLVYPRSVQTKNVFFFAVRKKTCTFLFIVVSYDRLAQFTHAQYARCAKRTQTPETHSLVARAIYVHPTRLLAATRTHARRTQEEEGSARHQDNSNIFVSSSNHNIIIQERVQPRIGTSWATGT